MYRDVKNLKRETFFEDICDKYGNSPANESSEIKFLNKMIVMEMKITVAKQGITDKNLVLQVLDLVWLSILASNRQFKEI